MIYGILQGENGRIRYEVVHGDRQGQFHVDPDTGVVSIAQNLDREMISSYGKHMMISGYGKQMISGYGKQMISGYGT